MAKKASTDIKNNNRRILTMRLTAMGDVAMTAPIVASVCKENPDVTIDVLSTPFFEPFFEQLPNLHFIGTNIRKEKNGISALWRLFKQLRANNYTDILDLHDVLRTKVLRTLFRLSGTKVYKINKGHYEKHLLTTGRRHTQLRKMTDRYADVFRQANLSVPDALNFRPQWPLPPEAPIQEKGAETWIGISPFAQHKGKMYPSERMTAVIEGLLNEKNVRIFIFGGGEKEKAAATEMAGQRERVHVMVGVMPLKSEMALMSHLDCMISMDSSNMHLCSLFGTRVVSIWGATHPYAGFLGYGQSEEDVVQRNDLDCRPCSIFGNKPCKFGDYRCFDIDPQIVIRRVIKS